MSQGKGARKRAKQRRLQERRAKKQIMKALYTEYRDHGQNSKRNKIRRRRVNRLTARSHPNGRCHNVACKRCDPGGIFASGVGYTRNELYRLGRMDLIKERFGA